MSLNLDQVLIYQRIKTLFQNTPLQWVITIPIVLQMGIAIGLVSYLSFRNGQKAVNDLATQLRNEITARIQQKLEAYLETPHAINRLNASAFSLGELNVSNTDSVPQFLQQMKMSPYLNAVYCASEKNGEFLGISREPADSALQIMVSNPSTNATMYLYSVDVRGNRTYVLEKLRPYNPRFRPWYQAAVASGKPTWSDIYLDFTTQLPTITASLPVYDQLGYQLIGVCGADVLLSEELRQFLKSIKISESGQAFILDQNGLLISTSTDDPLTLGSGENLQRLNAIESQNSLVQATTQHLLQQFGNLGGIQRSQQLNFKINDQRLFVQVSPFNDNRGLDWLIVLVVPEADFMQRIQDHNRLTILLYILALGIAICLGIITSQWITKPILKLSQASQKIAKGDFDQNVNITAIQEFKTLSKAFNIMTFQIKESFANLEAKNIDLQQAKENFSQAKEQLEAVLNAVPGSVSWISSDGFYIGVNRHLSESLNLPSEQIIGQKIGFGSQNSEFSQFILDFLASSKNSDSQIISVNFKEKKRYYLMAVQKYQNGTATVSVGIDITEKKQAEEALRLAEEKYRSIYENALEGIFQSLPDGTYLSINPAMAKIYGYQSPEDMIQDVKNISQQIYIQEADRERFKQIMQEEGEVKEFEYQAYRKDGSKIWVCENTRSVCDQHGNLLYYEGILVDITQRKQEEEALKRELEELKIEIDHQKRAKTVAEITQSDYFKELQEAAELLRFDDEDF